MYRVLLLDDRPQVRIPLEATFIRDGMTVFSCKSVYAANDVWNDPETEIDAIVLDIMMPPSGLSAEHRKRSQAGWLTGWIWLWESLNPEKKTMHPATDKCVIIYSAYLDDFNDYIKGPIPKEDEKAFATNVKCVAKSDKSGVETILACLRNNRAHRRIGI